MASDIRRHFPAIAPEKIGRDHTDTRSKTLSHQYVNEASQLYFREVFVAAITAFSKNP